MKQKKINTIIPISYYTYRKYCSYLQLKKYDISQISLKALTMFKNVIMYWF